MSDPTPRYDIELPVRLVPVGSEDGFTGVSRNISETGVLVSGERLEPLGTFLRLEFPIFEATGEVIWTSESEEEPGILLGMRFASLSRKDRKMLILLLGRAERDGPHL